MVLSATHQAMGAGGETVTLKKVYTGNVRYLATGASFRDQPNSVDDCSFVGSNQRTVNVNLPVGATVLDAWLYVAGGADIAGDQGGTVIDINDQTNLRLNGVLIPTSPGADDRNFNDLTNLGSGNVDFWGIRREVSDIVTGSGSYTLSGIVTHREPPNGGRTTTGTCLGAFALIVVYEDPSLTNIRVINLFDGFRDFQNSNFTLVPRNFVVGSNSPQGFMTHLSLEGDETITGTERFELQVGAGANQSKTNALNPVDNQYNSTVTGPDVFDTNTTYGLDLDTYDISSQLATEAGAFEALTGYISGGDLVVLMAEVISVDNKDLADIEVFVTDVGQFTANTTNSASYEIDVRNNGDGTGNPVTGFATGYIHVYDDLPAGISIDSLGDITAPGWDCSATNVALDEIRCRYDLSTLGDGQLDLNEYLPTIQITVDVASPASPVTNRAYASLCGATDTCVDFNEKHTDADQFDPKNFFEDFQDLFDILTKSSTNNNVDVEVTPIITGTPSNLSTSAKSVSDVNGGTVDPGDTVEYTITLTETNGVAATGVTVTDVIDTDLVSASYSSSTCAGATPSLSLGVLTVSGISVPASSSCNVIFQANIRATATAGTQITNTAEISSSNGPDVDAIAPTLLVAGAAAGSKPLYLRNVNLGSRFLSRVPPTSDTTSSIPPGASRTFNLNPAVVANLDINAGIIPVSIWVDAPTTAGNYSLTATLRYNSGTLIGSDTISGVTLATGIGNAQLFPFQINLGSNITNLSGQNISLQITNNGGSAGNARIHSKLNSVESSVVLDADTVINVDSISFFDAGGSPITSLEAGQDIRIEALVSDPFGAADITSAELTLNDPTNATQLNGVPMTVIATGTGTKTFRYTYTVPAATAVAPGTWTATVLANEGTEGTVTHADDNTFDVTAPQVDIEYTVDQITADANDVLTYTVTIDNLGVAATSLDINGLAVPGLTGSLNVTNAGGGDASGSTSGTINITGIVVGGGSQVTVEFEVTVSGSAERGDIINHTIELVNMGNTLSDAAPSVIIDPFATPIANKLLYADNLAVTRVLDRTVPVSDTTTVVPSLGGSTTLTLSPVLQSSLTLEDLASGTTPDITASVWISRNVSATGERTIEAELAYSGASSGTIGIDTVTLELEAGAPGAQYVPFEFDLPSDLTLLPNTSITLTLTNDTAVSGESFTVHSYEDSTNPSQVAFTATSPLTITDIRVFDGDIDGGGLEIGDADPGDTIWVVATAEDPFGAADITGAELTITDPNSLVTLNGAAMNIPTTQPASGAQRNFQLSHTLSAELGNWDIAVTADEGSEGLVTATDNLAFNVNNLNPDVSTSYKTVVNETSANNNAGDTLNYEVVVVESGASSLADTQVVDTFSPFVTYVPSSLEVCVDTAPPSTCTALTAGVDFIDDSTGSVLDINSFTVPPDGEVRISYDVTINGGVSPGDVISNDANISSTSDPSIDVDVRAPDIVVFGAAATGTKVLYLQDINSAGNEILTRTLPAASTNRTLAEGASFTMNLSPALTKAITLTSTTTIPIDLVLQRAGTAFANRTVTLELGHGPNAGSITPIANQTLTLGVTETISVESFALPVASTTSIPAGNILQLRITNASSGFFTRNLTVYTTSGGNRSEIELEMTPKINIDTLTFHDDELGNGGGTEITNADPGDTIYVRAVVSDPFGEDDIESVDDEPTISLNPPAGGGGSATVTFVSPEFDDGDASTRSFEWEVVLPPEGTGGTQRPRGTWTFTVTANEGSEETIGGPTFVSQTVAKGFSTLDAPNLSTSMKSFSVTGDVDPGDMLTYTITLTNTGGQDADNVTFTDTLQTSPVALTFFSASTTCTNEVGSPLPSPSHAAGVVSLSNISVTGGGSCTITLTVSVGAGSPGDTIDNQASIVNPGGPGATPTAPTILLSESQIPAPGNKQLYLDGIGGGSTLTRTQPTSSSAVTVTDGASTTLTYPVAGTATAGTLNPGTVQVNLWLASSGDFTFFNRTIDVELLVDAADGGGFQSVDSLQLSIVLGTTASLQTFSLSSSTLALNAGARFRIVISNNSPDFGNVDFVVSQVTSAPFSEVVVPILQPLEVTEITFWDVSGNDSGGCTPNCGTQIDPGAVATGDTIWARATVTDLFGSDDINTGCDTLVSTTNCPTFTLTDPTAGDQTPGSNILSWLQDPGAATRQFEVELNPAGFGLEGDWTVEVEATEGVEATIFDTLSASFERFGPPVLTVVKSVSGTPTPGNILTYTNNVSNSGTGPATAVTLTNDIGDFQTIELTESGGSWTAVETLEAPYTVNTETFDDGGNTFTYDPTGFCGAAIPTNSPCFDPAVRQFRILLNETFPVGNDFDQTYRVQVDN